MQTQQFEDIQPIYLVYIFNKLRERLQNIQTKNVLLQFIDDEAITRFYELQSTIKFNAWRVFAQHKNQYYYMYQTL